MFHLSQTDMMSPQSSVVFFSSVTFSTKVSNCVLESPKIPILKDLMGFLMPTHHWEAVLEPHCSCLLKLAPFRNGYQF